MPWLLFPPLADLFKTNDKFCFGSAVPFRSVGVRGVLLHFLYLTLPHLFVSNASRLLEALKWRMQQ